MKEKKPYFITFNEDLLRCKNGKTLNLGSECLSFGKVGYAVNYKNKCCRLILLGKKLTQKMPKNK